MCYYWNRGWEARRPDLAEKFAKMGTWRLPTLAGFFDWNTHFVVFSGGVERGHGCLTARSSWKIRQNWGWEARRLDLAGAFSLPPPCYSYIHILQEITINNNTPHLKSLMKQTRRAVLGRPAIKILGGDLTFSGQPILALLTVPSLLSGNAASFVFKGTSTLYNWSSYDGDFSTLFIAN